MKNRVFLVILSFGILLVGCGTERETYVNKNIEITKLQEEINYLKETINKNNETILELQEKIQGLESNDLEQDNLINKQGIEIETFLKTYNLADRFIQSYIKKDLKEIPLITSDKFMIYNEYISYLYEDEEIKLPFVDKDMTYRLNINRFALENNEVFYQYIVYEEPYKGVENGFFINLKIRLVDGIWEIDNIEFDI